jgi:hypothetical protein
MSGPQKASELVPATEKPSERTTTGVGALPRRRRLRLSVRGLLCVIVVIACGLAWVAHFIRAGTAQSAWVREIQRSGGWVLYDLDWNSDSAGHALPLKYPRWLTQSVGNEYFGDVVFVTLHDRGSDTVLAAVGRLTHLKQLHRCGPAVTDAGLAHLGALRKLELLSLNDSQITDSGLLELAKLTRLRWLSIARTKVTDAGVRALERALPELKISR